MNNIYKIEARRIMREHSKKLEGIYVGTETLEIFNASAKVTVEQIIKETLEEYTNDENHERVLYYQKVLNELEIMFL